VKSTVGIDCVNPFKIDTVHVAWTTGDPRSGRLHQTPIEAKIIRYLLYKSWHNYPIHRPRFSLPSHEALRYLAPCSFHGLAAGLSAGIIARLARQRRIGVSTFSSTAVLPKSCPTHQRCCRSAYHLRCLLSMSLHRCLPPRVWLLAGSCLALLFLVFSLSGGGLFPSRLPSLHHDILDDISNATLGVCFLCASANSKSIHLHTRFKVSEDLRHRLARAYRSQRFNVSGRGIDWPQHRVRRWSHLSGQQNSPAWGCRKRT
jgi:hypothetical protein